MTSTELGARLDLACRLARQASDLLLDFQRRRLSVEKKGSQDFVTQADRAVETLIRTAVAKEFPGDCVLGEEEGGEASAPHLWVVDPIDGTINFIRGLPSFAISIAFVCGGRTELGVVQVPLLDECFVARRGFGATCNGEPIRVSECGALGDARIAAGYAQRGDREQHLEVLRRLMAAGSDIVKFNSAAVCLALVASGRLDGYVERELMAWDVLAGQLLVEEAGGWTNRFGRHGLTRRDDVLACSPGLLQELRVASGWTDQGASDAA